MKTSMTKQQLEDYAKLCQARNKGQLLTPDGLRFICEAHQFDPEAIGQHMLEVYAKFKSEKMI